jgi:hypothetical protein
MSKERILTLEEVRRRDQKLEELARPHLATIPIHEFDDDMMVWLNPYTGAWDINPCCINFTGNGQLCQGSVGSVLDRRAALKSRETKEDNSP